jgi:catechol 2,3-dioxygenase-like lactoylglutathione lyase family enzyme
MQEDGMIHGMNHFTVIAEDLDRTLEFYTGLLGLQMGPRPDLGFPGAWLYADGRPILHVYTDRPVPAQRAGVIDPLRRARHSLRPAATEGRGHVAVVLHRSERRQGRTRFRAARSALNRRTGAANAVGRRREAVRPRSALRQDTAVYPV